MFWRRVGGLAAAACLCWVIDAHRAPASAGISKQRNGALLIAGRSVRCGRMRNVLDSRLDNLGLATPGVVVLNPRLLGRWPDTVRLFVFHHECGHHHVGASEMGADCWAARQGVRAGWLDRGGVRQICRSFGNDRATPTHPSSARRCASLERCFARAAAAEDRRRTAAAANRPPASTPAPKLISGPTLRRSGARAE